MYYRATRAPARRWLPIPVHALFEQATVTHAPGLTLVYGPGAPGHGNLLMSHSEVGVGTDQFGNQYQDGDTAYRDAFIMPLRGADSACTSRTPTPAPCNGGQKRRTT